MSAHEVLADLLGGARVLGLRVAYIVIAPVDARAGAFRDHLQQVGDIAAVFLLSAVGVQGGGNGVGQVADAQQVQQVGAQGADGAEPLRVAGYR